MARSQPTHQQEFAPAPRRHPRAGGAAVGRPPAPALARQAESRPQRRVRRRKPKKEKEPAAKRYATIIQFDFYDLLQACDTGLYYIGWYDRRAQQSRRRSLKTAVEKDARNVVSRIDASGMTGDPLPMLDGLAACNIAGVLQHYRVAHATAPSAAFNDIAIDKHLVPMIGHIAVDEWTKADFTRFQDAFLARGLALGYFSRICAVLRAALREAVDAGRVARAPRIPEPMTEEDRDDAPFKGRVMTPVEIARLFDQVSAPHFLQYLIAAINSGGRPATILGSDTNQIDWSSPTAVFDMNAPGRRQNKKYRPTIRVSATWKPWLKAAAPGPLIVYRGQPVKSVKIAFRVAREAAGLEPDADGIGVTGYSLRHSLGRFLEGCDVPPIERSILLGHVKTHNKKTTERYSPTNPRNPRFLHHATRAIEKFVRAINAHTKKWDLLVPYAVKPGYDPDAWRKPDAGKPAKARRRTRKENG